MKKIISVFIALSMFLTPLPIFAEESDLESKAEALAAVVLATGASGVQYALIDNGDIVLSGGADAYKVTSNVLDYSNEIYGVGSVSKMYVSAAVMKLASEGRVDIDKPVVTYIPEFKMDDERYVSITPRMLLNHSSGLYGSTLVNAFLFDDNDTYAHDNFLSQLERQKLKADPGEFSVYSNDSFTLLEILVEKVSGISYSEYLHTYITEPMGLHSTKTPQDDFDRKNLADIYMLGDDTPLPFDTVNIIGSGGIYTTARELVMFSEVLMGNKEDILPSEYAQAMMEEEFRNGLWVSETENTLAYGLGWDSVKLPPFGKYGITALTKGGDTLFYHSSLVALPEYGISMAVLSSGSTSTISQLMAINILQEYLLEKGIINEIAPAIEIEPPVKEKIPEELLKYAGFYASSMGFANIYLIEDELIARTYVNGMEIAQVYAYTGNGQFKNEDGSVTLSFEENGGRTYLKSDICVSIPTLGQFSGSVYDSQLLEPNLLTEDVSNAWAGRDGKTYYVVNEKYTSQLYILSGLFTMMLVDFENGYVFGGIRIVDEDNAVSAVQIPMSAGRDVSDINFFNEDGIEYLKTKEYILISGDDVPSISSEDNSVCTIQQKGYARWYTIGEDSAGRIINVDMPANASFAVYDENMSCISFTAAGGENTVELPNGGTIVFVGNPGDMFKISMN